MIHYLISLRVVNKDSVCIAAQPIVAVLVLHHGIDVAQLQISDAGQALLKLVHTIFIGRDPYQSEIVDINLARRIVTDRGFIKLIVQELANLFILTVNDKYSHVVGSHPHTVLVVYLDIPYLQAFGQSLDTLRQHQLTNC